MTLIKRSLQLTGIFISDLPGYFLNLVIWFIKISENGENAHHNNNVRAQSEKLKHLTAC